MAQVPNSFSTFLPETNSIETSNTLSPETSASLISEKINSVSPLSNLFNADTAAPATSIKSFPVVFDPLQIPTKISSPFLSSTSAEILRPLRTETDSQTKRDSTAKTGLAAGSVDIFLETWGVSSNIGSEIGSALAHSLS